LNPVWSTSLRPSGYGLACQPREGTAARTASPNKAKAATAKLANSERRRATTWQALCLAEALSRFDKLKALGKSKGLSNGAKADNTIAVNEAGPP